MERGTGIVKEGNGEKEGLPWARERERVLLINIRIHVMCTLCLQCVIMII